MKAEQQLRRQIKRWLVVFIVFLILSGASAFPLETELAWLNEHNSSFPIELKNWLTKIHTAIIYSNRVHPQLAYGTDWLAFSHIAIAVAFIGPLIDPVRNKFIFVFGIIVCALIFPLAFICGPIRQIPFYWQLIDCSFGLFGAIPLIICYRKVTCIETTITAKQQ
jgi:hypothetical protein